MIAILDYGAGNLRSVQNTLGEIGCNFNLVRDADGPCSAVKDACSTDARLKDQLPSTKGLL